MSVNTTAQIAQTTEETVESVNRMTTYIQEHIPTVLSFGMKVIFAILFFLIGRVLIRQIRKLVSRSLSHASVDKGVQQFADSFLKFGLYLLLLFSIATKFGVDTTSVAALIASAGVAVGLALQGSLSNLAGGVLILVLKPFKVGDYIIEHTNQNEGTVKEIQIFYTKLSTVDNKIIVIPNGTLTNNSLTNVTERDERQLDLKISVSYQADLKRAKEVVYGVLRSEPMLRQEEEMLVFVSELGEDAVILGVRAWVANEDYWPVRWRLLENIKLAMDREKIEIPYRQLQVHGAEKFRRDS